MICLSSYRTPVSSGGNGRNFLLRKAASSCAGGLSANGSKTPNSGPRINPFDSQISHDTLHLPTFSPSVFSTVLSPSQESVSPFSWQIDSAQCTEGWDCDLGIWGSKIFFTNNGLGASLDPNGRYSTMEPSGITFRGSQQLSEVGLVVKKWLKSGEKSILYFCTKMCNKCSELVKNWWAWKI